MIRKLAISGFRSISLCEITFDHAGLWSVDSIWRLEKYVKPFMMRK